ncbi:MAG: hypothetical protein SPJ13_03830, partial [Bacteroidales bacterium]|nr:hypothetical protein [Bacteroidales bacterium]
NSSRSSNSSANRSSNSSFNSGRSSRPAKGISSHSSSFSRGNNSSTPIDSYRGSSNGRGSHSTLRLDGNLSNTERGRGETPVVKGGNGRDNGNSGVRPSNERGNKGNNMGRTVTSGSVNSDNNGHRYATPYRPNAPLPATENHVHIHPAPYFYHPYHHVHIHMRPVYWNPYPFVPVYWPGFWGYCNNYWYDYHVTNTVVVREYVRNNYNVNLVSYVVSGNLMYAIIDDIDGKTYLKVFDDRDNLLAEQRINHRYNKCELDRENGGCWIFKNRNKSPMLFLYVDGQLLIYEED